jgi:hypothetical protein
VWLCLFSCALSVQQPPELPLNPYPDCLKNLPIAISRLAQVMSEYYSDYNSDDGNESDDDLILSLDLNTSAADQIVRAAKRTTTNFQSRLKGQQETLDIVGSTILSGVEKDLILRVIKASKPQHDKSKARERWV